MLLQRGGDESRGGDVRMAWSFRSLCGKCKIGNKRKRPNWESAVFCFFLILNVSVSWLMTSLPKKTAKCKILEQKGSHPTHLCHFAGSWPHLTSWGGRCGNTAQCCGWRPQQEEWVKCNRFAKLNKARIFFLSERQLVCDHANTPILYTRRYDYVWYIYIYMCMTIYLYCMWHTLTYILYIFRLLYMNITPNSYTWT